MEINQREKEDQQKVEFSFVLERDDVKNDELVSTLMNMNLSTNFSTAKELILNVKMFLSESTQDIHRISFLEKLQELMASIYNSQASLGQASLIKALQEMIEANSNENAILFALYNLPDEEKETIIKLEGVEMCFRDNFALLSTTIEKTNIFENLCFEFSKAILNSLAFLKSGKNNSPTHSLPASLT